MNSAAQIIDALAEVAIPYNNQLIEFSFHKTANISIPIISLAFTRDGSKKFNHQVVMLIEKSLYPRNNEKLKKS